MDVVKAVKECLSKWDSGGQIECQNILVQPHCSPTDSHSAHVLTTVYQTLLYSTLKAWPQEQSLTPDAFVTFVKSVLHSLPSSSSQTVTPTSNVAIFGEYLVDIIWALDVSLDEAEVKPADTPAPSKEKKQPETDKDRLVEIVKGLVKLNILSPSLCRERWELGLTAACGLFADKTQMEKREIRLRTSLFYKQNKFNLLREQSEGYTKLTAELTSGLPPSHSPHTGRPTESFALIQERARPVWEKVTSLIGYFDLDPNRALDLILDVLSVHLTTHYTFFLAILSLSPWCGSYRPIGLVRETSMVSDPAPNQYHGKSLDEVLSLAVPADRNEPLSDNDPRVLAQVLGFKFTYYAKSGVTEIPSKNLYLAAALLIREGLITLEDLYPHLSPPDEEMDSYRKAYVADIANRIAGAKNSLLAMAAPLESSASGSKTKASSSSEPKKQNDKPVPSQKASMTIALLTVGALRPAIWMMSKFPWLVDAHPEIADLMIRVLKYSIASLYERELVTKERITSFNQPRARWGATGPVYPPPRRKILTSTAPTPPGTNTLDFIFFYPDWVEQVPICSTVDDVEYVLEPLMRFVGVHISRDPLFITKFLRLGRLQLQAMTPLDPDTKKPSGDADPNHPIRQFWYRMLRMYLLPALPLIRGNAVCTVEVWNILRQYETTTRWRLYGEWKGASYKSHPELRIREVQADREAKGILRRLSSNTTDSLSGAVAKLAHSNPCIFFRNAVNQIMAYDNLASVVVQAMRYVTNMGFDVLLYIILEALANGDKERLKEDGVNTADWLQSLAAFAGMLFRRYSTDITPILHYVVHQLHGNQTTDIIVLRELIWKMAGIEPLPSLSDSQVIAMAGGPVLRIEAIASSTRGARLDPGDAVYKGPHRLGRALLDSSLALPILIQVAQKRQSAVFQAPESHLKSLASLYDATHGVLLQYLELLASPSVITPTEYATKIVPSLADLGAKYGICAPICMQIIRPVLQASLLAAALEVDAKERVENERAEKRLKEKLAAAKRPSRMASPAVASAPSETDVKTLPGVEDITMDMETAPLPSAESVPESPWLPQLERLFGDVQMILPPKPFELIGPGFYTTFWQLSTYDLVPPLAKYNEENIALRTLSKQEDAKLYSAERSSDRAKRQGALLHRQRRERYNSFANMLTQELKEQTVSRQFTLKRLAREKNHWFSHIGTRTSLLAMALTEHCIQPRSLLSPMDADFCAHMIKVMHVQGTIGFHTLRVYDGLLGDHIKVILFSCSEYEARNYGRFLLGILSDLYKWHQDMELYLSENTTKSKAFLPGFFTKYHNPSHEGCLKHSGFVVLVKKWHRKLCKAFTECIESKEFMRLYNAIIVLKEILPVFPLATVNDATGTSLDHAMDDLIQNEERGDLKILARAYSASLKKREKLWAPPKPSKKANGASGTKSTTTSASDKARTGVPPTGPSSRSSPQASLAPSAPRAQLPSSNLNPSKAAAESLRPSVVKRVRPDANNSNQTKGSIQQGEPSKAPVPGETPQPSTATKEPPQSPRSHRAGEDKGRPSTPSMPPPTAPSQTPSAQELRETARQSIRVEKQDEKSPTDIVQKAASPQGRSPSPTSRPGTRNHSSDSRNGTTSRVPAGGDPDDKRSDLPPPIRRDSITHNRSDRSGRDRPNRDDERGRDRQGDREHLRDRDHRDRDRERDKDRDRDRHRRDDKDREKKDRGLASGPSTTASDDRGSSGRSDPSRYRNGVPGDDAPGGKRRRTTDDDADRPPKRGSRKEPHRDDRNRKPLDKERASGGRESDRRRRGERGGSDIDNGRPEQNGDQRPDNETPTKSSPGFPAPSGPRGYRPSSLTDVRAGKPDFTRDTRDKDRNRDNAAPPSGPSTPSGSGLLNRIGEKDNTRQPLIPNPYPGASRGGRDGGRKRNIMDREGEAGDSQGSDSQKRPRLRYGVGQANSWMNKND